MQRNYYNLFFGDSDDDCVCSDFDGSIEEKEESADETSGPMCEIDHDMDDYAENDEIIGRKKIRKRKQNKDKMVSYNGTNCYRNRRSSMASIVSKARHRKPKRKALTEFSSEEVRQPKRRASNRKQSDSLMEHERQRKRRGNGSATYRNNSSVKKNAYTKKKETSENRFLRKIMTVIKEFLNRKSNPRNKSSLKKSPHQSNRRKKQVSIHVKETEQDKPPDRENTEMNSNPDPNAQKTETEVQGKTSVQDETSVQGEVIVQDEAVSENCNYKEETNDTNTTAYVAQIKNNDIEIC